jgi:hypothetical protein
VLTGIWDWRAIFWFNLAFGAAALGLGTLVLPESADPDAHRVDIAGTVLGAVALSALVFAVISAETAGFAAPDVFGAGLLLTAVTISPSPRFAQLAAGQGKIVQDVIHAAYAAFYSGLQAALFLSAALVLAAGLFTIIMFRKPGPPSGTVNNPTTRGRLRPQQK